VNYGEIFLHFEKTLQYDWVDLAHPFLVGAYLACLLACLSHLKKHLTNSSWVYAWREEGIFDREIFDRIAPMDWGDNNTSRH
jgi:hypothetical protein